MKITIITPSYRNDLELAKDLCWSIDRYARDDYEHILVVPASDKDLFCSLVGDRRRIVSREDLLLRHGIRRLPIPASIKLPFWRRKRLHEQYWVSGVGRASGWLVQQIVKLGAADYTDTDLIVFADSDAVLVRPFHAGIFSDEGRPIVQRHKRGSERASHQRWRRSAHELIGVDQPRSEPFNFIGQFVPWRRDVLKRLVARVEEVAKEPWRTAIARKRDVSEYILYGEFASELMDGEETSFRDLEIYRSVWWPDQEISVDLLLEGLEDHMVALHVQSTHPISPQARRSAIAEAGIRLAEVGSE